VWRTPQEGRQLANTPVARSETHDIAEFTMADMAACSAGFRRIGEDASSMEETAGRIVDYLYRQLSAQGSEGPLALVRLFKTHPYNELKPELQALASKLLGCRPAPSMKCLTLLGTIGTKPAWCSRGLSSGHQVIPLASEDGVARIPMIANLVHQFGLEVSEVLQPDPKLIVDLDQRTFNVFHVPVAAGSPVVPAQQEFVLREGIESVLGFGGMLRGGDLFAVIMFSRVPISRQTADLFKSLSLSVKIALLPFEARVFA
jgi:hypothetical protein